MNNKPTVKTVTGRKKKKSLKYPKIWPVRKPSRAFVEMGVGSR